MVRFLNFTTNKNKIIVLITASLFVTALLALAGTTYYKRQIAIAKKATSSPNSILNGNRLKKITAVDKKSFPLVNKLKGVESNIDEYVQSSRTTSSITAEETVKNANASLKGKIIVIDPMHGNPDNIGSTGPSGLTENYVVLEIAKTLKTLLEADSATVYMTRTTATSDMTNVQRGEYANSVKADLFLRLHADKATDDSLNKGFQIKYLKENSEELAKLFEKYLKAANRPSLGVYGRHEEGLAKAEVPAISIDVAKISNTDEEALLKDRNFLNSMAKSLYDASKEFLFNYSN